MYFFLFTISFEFENSFNMEFNLRGRTLWIMLLITHWRGWVGGSLFTERSGPAFIDMVYCCEISEELSTSQLSLDKKYTPNPHPPPPRTTHTFTQYVTMRINSCEEDGVNVMGVGRDVVNINRTSMEHQ